MLIQSTYQSRIFLFVSAGLAVAAIASLTNVNAAGSRHPNRSARFHSLHPNAAAAKATGASPKSVQSGDLKLPESLVDTMPVLKGYALAPVELNLEGKNAELVGLGAYLVNASHCADCHTNSLFMPGGDPFKGQTPVVNTAGYLGGGRVFGPVTSRNLTPEPENDNKPAGMDFEEFLFVMRTGEDTDQAHPQLSPLLQTMPWPELGRMTDHDLRAIYEYLSAIPPVNIPGVK